MDGDPAEEELGAELAEGAEAAKRFVEHLIRMGANNGMVPVLVEDELYEVSVVHKPVK